MRDAAHYIDPYHAYKELTLRGVLLGIIITILFTASNVYLGLKVGLTFASSIPAAVLAMAVLKFFKDSNILENNMVQTQASAAGTLSSVVFIIPGLLMLGYWQSFPFWQTTLICMSGGILGVIFTIPLRQVMVVNSTLPYPEGIAAAEILKTGATGIVANQQGEVIQNEDDNQDKSQANDIVYAGVLAAFVSFLSGGLRVIADSSSFWFKMGSGIFQIPLGFSLALLGAGSLIGIAAGVAILSGVILAWGIAVPIFSSLSPQPDNLDMITFAQQIWTQKVRMMGVGVIGIAAIWTLLSLVKPMFEGVRLSIAAYSNKNSQQPQNRAQRDLSPRLMLWISIAMALILVATFYSFIAASNLNAALAWGLVLVVTILTLVIGFLVAAACGYMAGLVGSSSSPISGIGILAVLLFAIIFLLIGNSQGLTTTEDGQHFLTALTLFGTTAVLAIATISNDNLQDLKTGYLIHATPARQQIALIIGCVVGALVIAPILDLLYHAYGFSGAMPRPDMNPQLALAAPQALLMTTLSQGIFSHALEWGYILLGVSIGAALIVLDCLLKYFSHDKFSFPILAVGMGVYLPPTVNIPLVIGAGLFWFIQSQVKKSKAPNVEQRLKKVEQRSTLFAAGLIVGESLMGVILAIIIVISLSMGGSDAPLALDLPRWGLMAESLGFLVFSVTILFFMVRCLKRD